ncbi:DUF2914 domain-containing protein [Neptunicella marina]|uniref:DUF2914 domain-containing protein n=1 Tax=Neptunicella marina TaxID=2125989 RepID=A0A8J6IVT1_9ALTE|nr:DUF2914 domain-containing protein [Neptunicella marina]MBC3766481.1 DUF2914 domain-containing protein [Neptunicella marina]
MKNILMILLMLFSLQASAQSQIPRTQLTSAIVNREPVDDLANQVEVGQDIVTVYFYNQTRNLKGQQLLHRWFYQGELKAEVSLNIGSDYWRTYSSKRIRPDWSGQWQVQVVLNNGVVASHNFSVVNSDT